MWRSVWAGETGSGGPHCLSRSLRPLASLQTGTGVKEGSASEMGFISRWPPPAPPDPPGTPAPRRGTAAERGARNGLES